jgi:hypothetical protein
MSSVLFCLFYAALALAGPCATSFEAVGEPAVVYRTDSHAYAGFSPARGPKSYLDRASGDLLPASTSGKYTPVDHIAAKRGIAHEDPSQFTSFTARANLGTYGNGQHIELRLRDLRADIDAGKVKDVRILTNQQLQQQFRGKIAATLAAEKIAPSEAARLQSELDYAIYVSVEEAQRKGVSSTAASIGMIKTFNDVITSHPAVVHSISEEGLYELHENVQASVLSQIDQEFLVQGRIPKRYLKY